MEFGTAFLLGFAGSLHCAAMCGPLVLALAKSQPGLPRPAAGRICYHLGRVTTYLGLGLMSGLVGQAAGAAGRQQWLSLTLGFSVLAAFLFSWKFPGAAPVSPWVGRIRFAMRGLIPRRTLAAQTALGALNGLLPCGLVYLATAGATATGNAFSGAAYMACFGLGTLPMMLGIHLAGQRLPLPAHWSPRHITQAAVLGMAALLILRGFELGIPFVSPDFSTAGAEGLRCH